MFESWNTRQRVDEAKRVTDRVLDHIHYLLDLHENNAIILYSDTLSKQIPRPYAANAFNVFQSAMHQIEIVRLCALWDDPPHIETESIPTIIALIDDPEVLEALAEETRSHHTSIPTVVFKSEPESEQEERIVAEAFDQANAEFGNSQAARALESLRSAITQSKQIRESSRLASIRNLRNKHLAHSVRVTKQEKRQAEKGTAIAPAKYHDERIILDETIPIVEALSGWVRGASISLEDSRETDREYATALWSGCTFRIG
jgi:hypothetical protein